MKKTCLIALAALLAVSCDLLFNRDSGSNLPTNDIAVSAINAPMVKKGDVAAIDVLVRNPGTLDVSGEIEITLTDQTEGVTIGTRTISDGLAPSDSVTLSYSWSTENSEVGDHTIVAKHNLNDDNIENDSLSSVLSIGNPDITDLSVSAIDAPSMTNQGEEVNVEVTVSNIGNLDVNEEIAVTLADDTDGTEIGTQTVSEGVAAGESTTLTFSWDTEEASVGEHTLTAIQAFSDENDTNDSRSQTITVNEALIPDIAITSLDVQDQADQGDDINVSITVENTGNKDVEDDFQVTLSDQTDGNEITSQTVSGGLASGNKVVLSFNWDTEEASIGEHTLSAAHDLDDDETSNNTRSAEVTINEPPFFDIAIKKIKAPEQRRRGQEVDVEVELKNEGNRDVNKKITVTLVDQTEGETIGVMELDDGLEKGKSVKLEFEWDTEEASFGNHTLIARHNFSDDKSDNDSKSTEVFISFL